MKSKNYFKLLFCMAIMLLAGTFNYSSAQKCDNPPDCILNPDMVATQSGNLNPGFTTMNDWYYSHGTPTVQLGNGVGGSNSIWMWSYSGRGEGVYSCFNFRRNRTYRICLWVQSSNAINLGNLFIEATNGLNQPAYAASTTLPAVTTELIDNSFVNNAAWTQIVVDYTPTADFKQLWIYPFMQSPPINNQQYELRISRVHVIEQPLGYGLAVPCGGDIDLAGAAQPCVTTNWYDPAGVYIGSGSVNIPNADPSMSGDYTMEVVSGDCSYQIIIQVLVEECNCDEFEASFEADGSVNPVNFFETSTGPGTSVGWFWEFGDGMTSNLQNPNHLYASGGTYEVCLTVIRKVGNTTCCKRICMIIDVPEPDKALPSTGFNTKPMESPTNAVKFINNSSGTNEFTEYKWDFGDGFKSGVQNPAHVYAKEGEYNVCLVVTNYTYGDDGSLIEKNDNEYCNKVKVGGSAIYDINHGEVSVLPNPTKDGALVVVKNLVNTKVSLRSLTGVVVTTGENVNPNQYYLHMETLPAGLYIVEVKSDAGTKTIKLIKE